MERGEECSEVVRIQGEDRRREIHQDAIQSRDGWNQRDTKIEEGLRE